MLYIRFLNFQTQLQDVEKMYKDGDIQYGDIVCQQYNDKSSHLFMNGTWIKTLYNSKIKQNNEIEDDIEFLSTAIGNNSTNIDEVSTRLNDTSIRLNDVSTRLKDDYVNKTQYLKDEELIASTFADLNNKINNFDITKQLEPIYSNILNLNSSVQNLSDVLYTLTETENINNTIDTFKEVEKFLNNISDSSTLTELLLNTKDDIIDGISEYYYNIEEMDGKIGDINTSINNTSSRIKELEKLYSNGQIDSFIGNLNTSIKDASDNLNIVSGKVDEVSTKLDNTSTRLNDTSVKLNNVSTKLDNTSNNLNDTSIRLNDVSTRLKDDYVNKTQYLKDEELICSTFAELNNKINTNVNIVNASITQLADNIQNINFDSLKTEISNTYATKQQVNTIGNSIWNKVKETYVSSEKYNNDIETINNKISTYYTNDQIDLFISNLNTSIKDTSYNLNIISGKVDEVSTRLDDTSVRLNNVSTRLKEVSVNLNNTIISVSSNLKDTSTRLNTISQNENNTSSRLNEVSTRLNDTSVRLLNYLTINQYVKDEELIASTFADLNNKINNVGNIDFSNYYNIDQINEKISNINTSTNDISTNLSNTSTMLNDTSIRLNNVSTRLNNLYTNTQIDTFISNLNTSINNVSINTNKSIVDVSSRLNDTSIRLLNYLTINQYVKDEELIASTFADVNNKINSLYAEIAELKEQLKSSTK